MKATILIAICTIIIKQNYQEVYDVVWSENILWPSKKIHQMTKTPNVMDIIKFYKLPQSYHLLAEIINQNYQF